MEKRDREPEYIVDADITTSEQTLSGVEAHIYVPRSTMDAPIIILKPQADYFDMLGNADRPDMNAKIVGFEGRVERTIVANGLYLLDGNMRPAKDGMDATLRMGAQRLQDVNHIGNREMLPEDMELRFWITPNPALMPGIGRIAHRTGEVELTWAGEHVVKLGKWGSLVFLTHFTRERVTAYEERERSQLVACCEPAEGPEDAYERLTVVLVIASLATKIRTVCLGWDRISATVDGEASFEKLYKNDVVRPEQGEESRSMHDGLIPARDIEGFLQHGFDVLHEHPMRAAVESAVWALTPIRPRAVEGDFLILFAGLEELLASYKSEHDLDMVVDTERWRHIHRLLKQFIRNDLKEELSAAERSHFYANLTGLNRIPLRVVFSDFSKEFGVDDGDLWGAFEEARGPSLYRIRNKLTHGETFPPDALEALVVARHHLRLIVQRSVLGVLGWPLNDTSCGPGYLKMKVLEEFRIPDSAMDRIRRHL